MRHVTVLGLTLALGLAGVAAGQMPTTRPHAAPVAVKTPATRPHTAPAVKLWGEWAKISGLTSEQQTHMAGLHKQFQEMHKALELKEKAEMEALLTDAQRTALQDMRDQELVKRKLREQDRKRPTSAPAK